MPKGQTRDYNHGSRMDLSHLNPSQRRAVETIQGPLLVLAGAGSGKTRVITHRIAHILQLGIPPDEIVALSFTNKAAGEMGERLQHMVGSSVTKSLVLSTFHSLGVRMMRERPDDFGVPKRFTILDQGDVYGVVRSILRESGIHGVGQDRRFDLGAIVQRISLWKNEFLDQEDVAERAKWGSEYDEVAAEIYTDYASRLQALGAVDFDDLVVRVAATLAENEAARAYWQARFSYLIVDESQDTTTAHFQLLRWLLDEQQNLCVVGDDDQAIYGWRGAKVANILGFDMMFPKAQVIKLQENYRSRAPICDVANAVISHNEARYDKALVPTRGPGDAVQLAVCDDLAHEATFVCRTIWSLIKDELVPGSEIAVLYRSSRQARLIEEGLQDNNLEYRVLGGQAFYDKKDVKDVLAYLKVLVTPHDDIALRRALDVPSRGVGLKTLQRLERYARAHGKRLIDAVHNASDIPEISGRPKAALAQFSALIMHANRRARASRSVAEALRELLEEIGLREHILRETGSHESTKHRWMGIEWLLGSVKRFEQRAMQAGKGNWIEYISNLTLDKRETEEEGDGARQRGKISLATMHSAKGLEWSRVFVIGCDEGTIPHARVEAARASDAIEGDIEEERRLFYVAVTRARDKLWICRSKQKSERGRVQDNTASRFLSEIPDDALEPLDLHEPDDTTIEEFDAMTAELFASFGTT